MRSFYVPAGLLAVILAFSLWTCRYVDQRTDHWNALLEEINELARQENWEQAEEGLSAAYDDWESSQTFLHTIMDHSELDEAENLFAGSFAACQERDGADFHMLLAQLMGQLRLLAETQSISIKNVL